MSHLDKTIKHNIPEFLFKNLKKPESVVLTPGEIYGADRLYTLICNHIGGDVFEVLNKQKELINKTDELFFETGVLLEDEWTKIRTGV